MSPAYHQVLASHELGGANRAALGLAVHLRDQGWHAPVWVGGDGPALRHAESLGLRPRLFDQGALSRHGVVAPVVANLRLGWGLGRDGCGLVHSHGLLGFGASRLALRLAGQPTVVHVQIEEDAAALRWALRRPPDLIVTCARFLVDHVRRHLPEDVRDRQWIESVPNAVDTDRFRPGDRHEARLKVGVPPGKPLLLMLANLAAHKGQETAVAAVAELKCRGLDVVCWLAGVERFGRTEYTARLKARVAELGLDDRVALLGHRDDAPDLLRAADIFLLPSTQEGLPLTVLEAQATRVPVLAAPTAGVPEVVHDGETGFLIPAHDSGGYADRIARLLASAELAGRVAANAYEFATREHNWTSFTDRIVALYQDLLERTSGRSGSRTAP